MAMSIQERLASAARAVVGRIPLKRNLLSAAVRGDASRVRLLLRAGVDPGAKNWKKGESALFLASREGHEDVVGLLLEAGAKANEPVFIRRSTETHYSGFVATPLVIAAAKGHQRAVESLLILGAEPNRSAYLPDFGKASPLTAAIHGNSVGAVRSLLEAGANPKVPEALFAAVDSGSGELVEPLLEYGANPRERLVSRSGISEAHRSLWDSRDYREVNTALIWAAKTGHKRVLRRLLDFVTDLKDSDALCLATLLGDIDLIKSLLASGAGINVQDSNGHTALCRAVNTGNVESIKYLLNHGSDVNGVCSQGETTLMSTVTKDIEIMHVLVGAGAEVNAQDENGDGALHLACALRREDECFEVAQVLVDSRGDVNLRNNEGVTPLMKAAESNSPKTIELLLNVGADVHAKDQHGNGALHFACEQIIIGDTSDVARKLIDSGAMVNAKNRRGETPLMKAAESGLARVVELLLNRGADVNARSRDGATAVDSDKLAYYNPVVIELLVKAGAKSGLNADWDKGLPGSPGEYLLPSHFRAHLRFAAFVVLAVALIFLAYYFLGT